MGKNERFLYCFGMSTPTDSRQYSDLNRRERQSPSLRENLNGDTLETDTGYIFLIGKSISRDPHPTPFFMRKVKKFVGVEVFSISGVCRLRILGSSTLRKKSEISEKKSLICNNW